MANNTTLQNNIVTAGKFVTIGTGIETSKQTLRTIASAVAIEDQSALYRDVQEMMADGITPKEKKTLREMYNDIESRYAILTSSVAQVGYQGDDWDLVKNRYNDLEDEFRRILFDMDAAYTEPTNIDALIQNYQSVFSTFAISLESYINSSDGYTIRLNGPSKPLEAGDNLIVELSVISPDGIQYALRQEEIDTITWYFTGTNNDAGNTREGINPLNLSPTEWADMFTGRSIDINASLTIFPS